MGIHGLNKTTLLDYPGHVAATVFTGGCNFRCPFCHNGGLVLHPGEMPSIEEQEVLDFLKKRSGILEGVCVTGGEPTLQEDLLEFLARVKELGYLVKLDTNGSRPEVLRQVLEQGLADYVAMDIKASKDNYARAAGCGEMPVLASLEESVELLKNCAIEYEFRTTVVKGIHCPEEFEEIGEWLAGGKAYYLQSYRDNGEILAKQSGDGTVMFEAFSREELEDMARSAGRYIPRVTLRGVE